MAKARNPKSPDLEIQTGLNCGYDGLSEVILSFTHLVIVKKSRRTYQFPQVPQPHPLVTVGLTDVSLPENKGESVTLYSLLRSLLQ